ncbi:hypothetical protein JVU11DRAFT_10555 [Chiua virens]|nr:hypothetical protein JVU11DRAFT_10555 [Chiua virens]
MDFTDHSSEPNGTPFKATPIASVPSVFDNTFYCSHDVEVFLSPPTFEPLFPNLRYLCHVYYDDGDELSPLLYRSLASLVSITYVFAFGEPANLSGFHSENHLEPFPGGLQLITYMPDPETVISRVVSDFIAAGRTLGSCLVLWSL